MKRDTEEGLLWQDTDRQRIQYLIQQRAQSIIKSVQSFYCMECGIYVKFTGGGAWLIDGIHRVKTCEGHKEEKYTGSSRKATACCSGLSFRPSSLNFLRFLCIWKSLLTQNWFYWHFCFSSKRIWYAILRYLKVLSHSSWAMSWYMTLLSIQKNA